MTARPFYFAASPTLSRMGITVSDPSVMLFWWHVLCTKVDESLTRFAGRKRFSRISLKWTGSAAGKRIWSDEIAGGKKDGIPVGATVAGAGAVLGPRSSPCLMIRFRKASIWSAGREEARVEAKALPVAVTSGAVGVAVASDCCLGVAGSCSCAACTRRLIEFVVRPS